MNEMATDEENLVCVGGLIALFGATASRLPPLFGARVWKSTANLCDR